MKFHSIPSWGEVYVCLFWNQPYIPGKNHTCLWYIILFLYCWIQLTNILLKMFMFMKDIGL